MRQVRFEIQRGHIAGHIFEGSAPSVIITYARDVFTTILAARVSQPGPKIGKKRLVFSLVILDLSHVFLA